ncbi:MAG: hypothetical protein J6F30_01815 [Cellulosilyticum sp.]|nr:hypothetical protein [Cellulosilyticum sp.]
MKYQDTLLKAANKFEVEAKKQVALQGYYEMLACFAKELAQLVSQVQALKEKPIIKNKLIPYDGQYLAIMDELCETLEILEEESFTLVRGKKIYEVVDEMVADLEDWIENVNEILEDEGVNMSYLEAWDIGVFFL